MRDFILEQLNEIEKKGQLNEVDLSSMISKVRDKITGKSSKLNREFAEVVSKQFEGEFGYYLKKRLIKTGKKGNNIAILVSYFKDPSKENYNNVFRIIGVPMLEFFVKKVFGKTSLKGKIKQITPFLKKVSTGNRKLDTHVFLALSDVIENKKVQSQFKDKLKDLVDDKFNKAINDQEFYDFFADFWKDDEKQDDEEIEEGIGDTFRKVKRGARDMFSSYDEKYRWKVIDNIVDDIPKLKKSIIRDIKDDVWDLKFTEIRKIITQDNYNSLAKIVTKAILKHVVKQARELYFKEDYFAELTDLVEDVFLEPEVVKDVGEGIIQYYKDSQLIAKHLEKQKLAKKADKKRGRKLRSGEKTFKKIYKKQ